MEKKAHYQTAEERGLQERLELSTDHTHVDTWQSLKQRLIKVEERDYQPQNLRPVKRSCSDQIATLRVIVGLI